MSDIKMFVEVVVEEQKVIRRVVAQQCTGCAFRSQYSTEVIKHHLETHRNIQRKNDCFRITNADDYALVNTYISGCENAWREAGWYASWEDDDPYERGCKQTVLWPVSRILRELCDQRNSIAESIATYEELLK